MEFRVLYVAFVISRSLQGQKSYFGVLNAGLQAQNIAH